MGSAGQGSVLKQRLISELGEAAWDDSWESVAKLDPALLEASVNLMAVPRRNQHLSLKNQHLVALAVNSAVTHLYTPGIRRHMDAALKEGATREEIMEVVELTSCLGIHACSVGVPILVEVMKELNIDRPTDATHFDARQQKLKAKFTENRGYWNLNWEKLLSLDPEFFEAYLRLSSLPWTNDVSGSGQGAGVLEPKVRVLRFNTDQRDSASLLYPGVKPSDID
jgi:alkylhydroperoxidase/carboxymuconolactone decarboxylase family protein YurZ